MRAPLSFDLDKMELSLDGQVVKVYRFADEPDAPWFPAKALSMYLEYLQVTRALDHVDAEDRRSLKTLLETKGVPLGVGADFAPTLGYHEGKAVYINESGLYSLIFGSKKPEAKEFKLWVTRQVLPSLRRHGVYSLASSTNASVLALSSRVESLERELRQRDESLQRAVVAAAVGLQERADMLESHLQAHGAAQLEAARASFLEALGSKLKSYFQMALAGHLSAVVEAAVRAGLALKRAQPKKKTTNPAEMPEAQHATPVQTGPLSLGLSTVALELWPELPFAAWRRVRGAFGQRAKAERLRLNALGDAHADYVEMPLLWAYTGPTVQGGGARYVYLQEQRALLRRVFTQQLPTSKVQRAKGAPSPTESLEQRAHRLAAHLGKGEREQPWPIHAAELEPQWDELEEE